MKSANGSSSAGDFHTRLSTLMEQAITVRHFTRLQAEIFANVRIFTYSLMSLFPTQQLGRSGRHHINFDDPGPLEFKNVLIWQVGASAFHLHHNAGAELIMTVTSCTAACHQAAISTEPIQRIERSVLPKAIIPEYGPTLLQLANSFPRDTLSNIG